MAGEARVPATATHGDTSIARQVGLISVVICTRLRSDQLERCLRSLQSSPDRNYEVLVVDNAERPTLDERRLTDLGARVVLEPRVGLCFARNRGVAESRGDIVAFIDDDCEADAGWLPAMRDAFEDPTIAAVTGRVLAASQARHSHRWFEHFSTFDRGPTPRRYQFRSSPLFFFSSAELGSGCNMAFRRAVFDRVGLFDTALDVGMIRGGGDLDFFGRVLAAGVVFSYEPRAIVRHHHRSTMLALVRQLFGYGVGTGALCLKYFVYGTGSRSEFRAFLHRWLSGMTRMISRRRLVARPLGYLLMLVIIAGALCAPAPYARHRRRSR